MSVSVADGFLALLAAPVLAVGGYLGTFAALARRGGAPAGCQETRFDVIVPAHNETSGIGSTVASLLDLQYPRDRFRVIVVADNCTDDTAAVAQQAGARVLVRNEPERRGKGYALAHAYAASMADGFAEAVVVVDADSIVSSNLLSAFSARFAAGAEAVQAEYGVRNPADSWRTRLMVIAFALFHTVRSLARERLGLSCGLRGNGMGFSTSLLRRVPSDAYSVVEDVEYGITLGLAGTRVWYVAEAEVRGEMPATGAAARSQRARWERGRMLLIRAHVPALLRAWRGGGGRVPLDLALDLLIPPFTIVSAAALAGAAIAWFGHARGVVGSFTLATWLVALAGLTAYAGRGIVLSGVGVRGMGVLAWAPAYGLWKLALHVSGSRSSRRAEGWVRTRRAHDESARPTSK